MDIKEKRPVSRKDWSRVSNYSIIALHSALGKMDHRSNSMFQESVDCKSSSLEVLALSNLSDISVSTYRLCFSSIPAVASLPKDILQIPRLQSFLYGVTYSSIPSLICSQQDSKLVDTDTDQSFPGRD